VTGSRSRERSSTKLGSSIVPAAGSGSGWSSGSRTRASTRAGLERRKKKKTRLDMLKTLHRESAIALRYY
jgi:hypothetical protein